MYAKISTRGATSFPCVCGVCDRGGKRCALVILHQANPLPEGATVWKLRVCTSCARSLLSAASERKP